MEQTYAEYEEFLVEVVIEVDVECKMKDVESSYQSALGMVKKIYECEQKLDDDEKEWEERLSIYSNYLNIEFEEGRNPAHIQNLYERRIKDHCLHPHVWTTYIDYIDLTLKSESDSLSVCQRAIRNVPNSGAVWIKYIRALERYRKPKELVLSVIEKALSRNLMEGVTKYRELWLAYIDYKRRSLIKV